MSQPAGAERGEIGARRLRAGQQDQVGRLRQRPARLDHGDGDIGLGAQRIEIVEIGDARQARHGDEIGAAGALLRMIEGERILGREARRIGKIRHRAEARHAGALPR